MNYELNLIGFEFLDGQYKEYLPSSDQVHLIEQKRALFYSMYNFYVPKELRFDENEFNTKQTLLKIFTSKVESLMPISFISKHKMIKKFSIDIASTNIINNFLLLSNISKGRFLTKNMVKNSNILKKEPVLLLAKWIKLFFSHGQFEILFYLDDIFSNLVYGRIKKVNKDKKVTYLQEGISILGLDEDNTSTFVIPSFSSFDIKKMHLCQQISLAKIKLEEKTHNQIYFVYPKSNDFKKHIELKLPELSMSEDEYKVKLIPYSFSFCIKNIKGKER